MDNKITKKRFSDLFSYEWIFAIIVCLISIFVWELVYTVTAVQLTPGQKFHFYFDETVDGKSTPILQTLEGDTLSYDILSLSAEQLKSDFNVLSARLAIQEGDILITDNKQNYTEVQEGSNQVKKPKEIRVKKMVDEYGLYSLEQMLIDGQNYLKDNFLVDGADITAFNTFNEDNIDLEKVEKVFKSRMKNDNRFRKQSEIENGVELELKRIKLLYKNLVDFNKVLALKDEVPSLFTIYTKGEQSLEFATDDATIKRWQSVVDNEKKLGRENQIYAINIGALASSNYFNNKTKVNPSKFFTLAGSDSAENVCITAFNFTSYQPHLQFETIPFINAFIRACSTILD